MMYLIIKAVAHKGVNPHYRPPSNINLNTPEGHEWLKRQVATENDPKPMPQPDQADPHFLKDYAKAIALDPSIHAKFGDLPQGIWDDASLKQIALSSGDRGKNWYQEWAPYLLGIAKSHGMDDDRLKALFASMSTGADPVANTTKTAKVLSRHLSGLYDDPKRFEAQKAKGIHKALAHKGDYPGKISGVLKGDSADAKKVAQYGNNFWGDGTDVAGDVHMHRLLIGGSAGGPTDEQSTAIQGRCNDLARQLSQETGTKWTPAQTQAALWCGYKDKIKGHINDVIEHIKNTDSPAKSMIKRLEHVRDQNSDWGSGDDVAAHLNLHPDKPLPAFGVHKELAKVAGKVEHLHDEGHIHYGYYTHHKILDAPQGYKDQDSEAMRDKEGLHGVFFTDGGTVGIPKDLKENKIERLKRHGIYVDPKPMKAEAAATAGVGSDHKLVYANPDEVKKLVEDPEVGVPLARIHKHLRNIDAARAAGHSWAGHAADVGNTVQDLAAIAHKIHGDHPDAQVGPDEWLHANGHLDLQGRPLTHSHTGNKLYP